MRRFGFKLLVAMVATAGMMSVVGASTVGASPLGVYQADATASLTGERPVSGNQADGDVGVLLTCYNYFAHSGHTDRARWHHCHSTSDPYVKRVHICGVSGYLHGMTVMYLYGAWVRNESTHAHDFGGEGC